MERILLLFMVLVKNLAQNFNETRLDQFVTSSIEFNDKDKIDIEFIGSLLRRDKFLASKKISTEVSFTADKTIYLSQKKVIAEITFHKYKTGFFTKYYGLEIKYALSKGFIHRHPEFSHSYKVSRNDIWSLFNFYERQAFKINDREYDYSVVKFDDISFKIGNVLSKNIVLFIKMIPEKKVLTKNQSFKIWKKTGISSEEFVNSMFYRFDGK